MTYRSSLRLTRDDALPVLETQRNGPISLQAEANSSGIAGKGKKAGFCRRKLDKSRQGEPIPSPSNDCPNSMIISHLPIDVGCGLRKVAWTTACSRLSVQEI